jgi:hypothetical protein
MVIYKLSVSVYTRHSSSCPKKDNRHWRRCHCVKWLYINHNGKHTLRSAKTRSWDRADCIRRSLEHELESAAFRDQPGTSIDQSLE